MSKRILIIDDEENIRRVMRLTLEAAGYEANEASDGVRGLELYGDGAAWDAVLLDQKCPAWTDSKRSVTSKSVIRVRVS